MRTYMTQGKDEVLAIIGERLLTISRGEGYEARISVVHLTEDYLKHDDWLQGRTIPITEDNLKEFSAPILQAVSMLMGGGIPVALIRELRQAQREYYACKFPDQKQPLLKRARGLEDQMDKLLRRLEPPAFPEDPAGTREEMTKSLNAAIARVKELEDQIKAWPTFPPEQPSAIA